MKKAVAVLFVLIGALLFSACGKQEKNSGVWIEGESATEAEAAEETTRTVTEKQFDALSLKAVAPEKILTVYFDPRGNGEPVVQALSAELGCKVFELIPKNPYPETEEELVARANDEYDHILYPVPEALPEKAGEYEAVVVVFPELGGNIPMMIRLFLESYDFRYTAVLPVCLCEAAEPAYGMAQFRSLMTNCPVFDGLSILPGDDTAAKCAEWVASEIK